MAVNVKRGGGWFGVWLNFPVFKSSFTSRKLTTFLFTSTVIFRLLFANIWHICFFCFLCLPWFLIEYGKPVISVKANFDARDLLYLRQEITAHQFTSLRSVVASHGYVKI